MHRLMTSLLLWSCWRMRMWPQAWFYLVVRTQAQQSAWVSDPTKRDRPRTIQACLHIRAVVFVYLICIVGIAHEFLRFYKYTVLPISNTDLSFVTTYYVEYKEKSMVKSLLCIVYTEFFVRFWCSEKKIILFLYQVILENMVWNWILKIRSVSVRFFSTFVREIHV